MKRKRKLDFRDFLFKIYNKITRTQKYCITLFLLFFISNTFLTQNLISKEIKSTGSVLFIVNQFGIWFGIAFLILVLLISQYALKWIFFLKILVSYVIYLILSYSIDISLNINNPSYKIDHFQKNNFWQFNSLVFILSLLVISYVLGQIKKSYDNKANRKKLEPIGKLFEYVLHSSIVCSFIFTDSKILSFLYRTSWYVSGNFEKLGAGKYSLSQFWILEFYLLLLSIFLTLVGLLFVKGQVDVVKNRSSFSLAVFTSISLAILFNTGIQLGLGHGEPLVGYSIFPGGVIFQILCLSYLFIFLYILLNRYLFTTILILFGGVLFIVANAIKFSMRAEPILPSDLVWVFQPSVLFSFVDASVLMTVSISLVIFTFIYIIGRRYIYPGRIIRATILRFVLLGLMFLLSINVYSIFKRKDNGKIIDDVPIITLLNNFQDTKWLGNSINARYRSLSYVWLNQITTDPIIEPKGYSKEKIKEIEKKYDQVALEINKNRNELIDNQTIVYVLSESFADPSRIEGVSLSRNPIPKIQEIKAKVTSGLMQSDGYGGGTANMEFQTLTGLPFYNINPTVSVLYSEVAPKMKKLISVSDSFNNKEVIHFESPINYSRNVIYNRLKFNKFISIDDKKNYDLGYQEVHISDESTYKAVLKEMDAKKNQFFSVITIQNHSPFIAGEPSDLTATGRGFSDDENTKLTNYSRLLTFTDTATQSFLESLSKIDKKITVVFYGDHLPGLYPESAFKNNPESQYQTDYFIWSNFDAPKLNYPLVNSSDFSAMVFEQTNSKVSPYYALLTEVLKKASVDKKALEGEAQEIAEDLKMVEYDLISGKGYLSKDFFKVPTDKSN
ncbi:Lipoteichoic acid synthase LtaS Type IIc [Streptococcus parasanguinis]|uniref:LTA synthase family protein n=1 Tax=Streptococcus parasanguinis TaxID=1318 RepID=UPI000776B3DF|nr:sulfatase-like hydrolase/transferase [Streptococcus parasanguinis]KXT87792.1 Lipoteichoic acid synthase LtaS Type IIc [Streptococcus parasanguinis]